MTNLKMIETDCICDFCSLQRLIYCLGDIVLQESIILRVISNWRNA